MFYEKKRDEKSHDTVPLKVHMHEIFDFFFPGPLIPTLGYFFLKFEFARILKFESHLRIIRINRRNFFVKLEQNNYY